MEEMMMMQREKLPEIFHPQHRTFVAEENHFGSIIANTSNIGTSLYSGFSNLHVTSPIYLDSQIQEPLANAPLFLPNGGLGRGKLKCGHGISSDTFTTSALEKQNSMPAMREMIFRIAAMQPIHIDPESVKSPKRRNVKISKHPQSVAARHRRERISEKIRILQRLVPGGTKMDTASMLDEAIDYMKFLQKQVQSLERASVDVPMGAGVLKLR